MNDFANKGWTASGGARRRPVRAGAPRVPGEVAVR